MIAVRKFDKGVWEIVFGYHHDEVLLSTEDMQELSKKLKEAGF